MAKEVGRIQHLGFTHIDLKNYLRTKRTLEIKQGDNGGVLQYLQRMISEDPHFYYAIQLDVEDLITNIFWTDGRMIQDFGHFGDVVCFDTTCRKHRDGRPISLFVGVNHHKQTTVFGASLLYDETIETFEWLFGAFEDAMMGKRPKTTLTDQDQAMSAALAAKWLSTYHRLCVWHIFQNAAIHLSSVFSSFIAADFSRCVYDFEEESEFLDAWNEMLEKFNLKDNQWLARMFSLMEKWALVYGRSTFCADIITTQRSECMNAVVKHYVNYKNNIVEVFRHFQRLIDDRREKESIEDLKNAQSSPVMTFPLEILKHAATVYTHKMFALFSEELRKAFESKIESENQLGRKAVESEDSYTYAIDCLLTMGNDIDGMAGKTNNVTVEANKVGDISTNGDINESQIKGVKPKGRVTYQSSKRPKNALEQAISRKRKPKVAKSGLKHVSSTQESEGSKLINNEFWNLTYNVLALLKKAWYRFKTVKCSLRGKLPNRQLELKTKLLADAFSNASNYLSFIMNCV
ncbi:hypothetical protein SASPL_105142 [Salvia splendens]|uniref:Protein FAR1-RELATED SEQUENCE n=1 Tax=Salvia splendens TaxID=180675 RepID=A0A8X9A9P9_SALSN|nr:hypothetical protein SASPL_105142 [Salvia splendens]